MKSFLSLVCLVLLAAEGWCCTPEAGTKFLSCAAAAGVDFSISSINEVPALVTEMCQPGVVDDLVKCAKPVIAACKKVSPVVATILSQFDLSKMGDGLRYGCKHLPELSTQFMCIGENVDGLANCMNNATRAKVNEIVSAVVSGQSLSPEFIRNFICQVGKLQDRCISLHLSECGNAASIIKHMAQESRPDSCL